MSKWIYTCKQCKQEHLLRCQSCNRVNLKGKKVIRKSGKVEYFLECVSCGHFISKWFTGVSWDDSHTPSKCCYDIFLNSTTKHQFVKAGSQRHSKVSTDPQLKNRQQLNKGNNNMDENNQQKWYYKCVGCGKQDQVTCDNCRRDVFVNVNDFALRCANCKTEIRRVTHVCQRSTGEAIWDKEQSTTFNDFNLNRDMFYSQDNKVDDGGVGGKIIFIGLIVLGCLIGLSSL